MSACPSSGTLYIPEVSMSRRTDGLELNGDTANGEEATLCVCIWSVRHSCHYVLGVTYDVVVLAADRGSRALALSDTNNVDGRAIEADEGVGVDDDVKKVKESSDDASPIGLDKFMRLQKRAI